MSFSNLLCDDKPRIIAAIAAMLTRHDYILSLFGAMMNIAIIFALATFL
jgi:hypothetical protein